MIGLGFAAGVLVGAILLTFLGRAGRNTYRAAAFLDAAGLVAGFARSLGFLGRPPGERDPLWAVVKALETWADDPSGGSEKAPPVPLRGPGQQRIPYPSRRVELELLLLGPIQELAGEASMCWTPQPSSAVLDTAAAAAAAQRTATRCADLVGPRLAALETEVVDLAHERRKLERRVGHLSWVGGMVLGIAEGAPGWEDVHEYPAGNYVEADGAPAIRAVKALRRRFEGVQNQLSDLPARTKRILDLQSEVRGLVASRNEVERDLRDHVRQIHERNDRIDELTAQLKAVR